MSEHQTTTHCLLCGSDRINAKNSVPCSLVVEGYSNSYQIDVASYFNSASHISLVGCEDCGLLSYVPMPSGDASFYEALQRLPWYYQDVKPEYEFARTHVGVGDRVLEVGCGKGVFHSFLSSSVTYRGLEFNQVAIDKARSQGLDVTAQAIETHAEQHSDEYDVVCHFQVLEHVPDPAGFLNACVKALKPGGKLIVAVPAEDSFLSICEDGWLNMPPHHVTRWKDSTLQHAFQYELGLGLKAIWHEPVADYHLGWYRSILANHGLANLLGRRNGLVSGKGAGIRIARRLAKIKPIQNWLANRAEQRFGHAGQGHTVCMVGVKPAI